MSSKREGPSACLGQAHTRSERKCNMYSQTSTPNNGDPKVEGRHKGTKNKDLELPTSASRPSLVFSAYRGPATNNRPNGHSTSNKDKSAAHDTLGSGHSQRETPNPQPNNTQATLTKRVVGCSPTGLARGQSRRTNCPSTATSGALCSPAPIQYHKLRIAKVTSHCTSPQVQRRPSRHPSKNHL